MAEMHFLSKESCKEMLKSYLNDFGKVILKGSVPNKRISKVLDIMFQDYAEYPKILEKAETTNDPEIFTKLWEYMEGCLAPYFPDGNNRSTHQLYAMDAVALCKKLELYAQEMRSVLIGKLTYFVSSEILNKGAIITTIPSYQATPGHMKYLSQYLEPFDIGLAVTGIELTADIPLLKRLIRDTRKVLGTKDVVGVFTNVESFCPIAQNSKLTISETRNLAELRKKKQGIDAEIERNQELSKGIQERMGAHWDVEKTLLEAKMKQLEFQKRNSKLIEWQARIDISHRTLKDQLSKTKDGKSVKTFFISNKLYQEHLLGYPVINMPKLTVDGCGIPKLHNHIIRLILQRNFHTFKNHCIQDSKKVYAIFEELCESDKEKRSTLHDAYKTLRFDSRKKLRETYNSFVSYSIERVKQVIEENKSEVLKNVEAKCAEWEKSPPSTYQVRLSTDKESYNSNAQLLEPIVRMLEKELVALQAHTSHIPDKIAQQIPPWGDAIIADTVKILNLPSVVGTRLQAGLKSRLQETEPALQKAKARLIGIIENVRKKYCQNGKDRYFILEMQEVWQEAWRHILKHSPSDRDDINSLSALRYRTLLTVLTCTSGAGGNPFDKMVKRISKDLEKMRREEYIRGDVDKIWSITYSIIEQSLPEEIKRSDSLQNALQNQFEMVRGIELNLNLCKELHKNLC